MIAVVIRHVTRAIASVSTLVLVACATPQLPTAMPAQPALAQLCQPYMAQLNDAGVYSVTASGPAKFVRVSTREGGLYFPYPSDAPSTVFALRVSLLEGLRASSSDFDAGKVDQYRAAVKAVLTEAIAQAKSNNQVIMEESGGRGR